MQLSMNLQEQELTHDTRCDKIPQLLYVVVVVYISILSRTAPHFAGRRVHVCKSFLVYVLYREELYLGMDLGPAARIRIFIYLFIFSTVNA